MSCTTVSRCVLKIERRGRITNERTSPRQTAITLSDHYLLRKYLLCVGVRANLYFLLGPCALLFALFTHAHIQTHTLNFFHLICFARVRFYCGMMDCCVFTQEEGLCLSEIWLEKCFYKSNFEIT